MRVAEVTPFFVVEAPDGEFQEAPSSLTGGGTQPVSESSSQEGLDDVTEEESQDGLLRFAEFLKEQRRQFKDRSKEQVKRKGTSIHELGMKRYQQTMEAIETTMIKTKGLYIDHAA